MTKWIWTGVAVGVASLLGGCGVASSPLVVQVRDQETHEPVVGAGVAADSAALGPSLKLGDVVDDLMGKRAALSSRGVTDATGTAHLEFAPGRSIRLTLLDGTGHAPVILIENDVDAAPTPWLEMLQSPSQPGIREIRVGTPRNISEQQPVSGDLGGR